MIDETKLLERLDALYQDVANKEVSTVDRNSRTFYGAYMTCLSDVKRAIEALKSTVPQGKKA